MTKESKAGKAAKRLSPIDIDLTCCNLFVAALVLNLFHLVTPIVIQDRVSTNEIQNDGTTLLPKIRLSLVESQVIKEVISEVAGSRVVIPVTKYDLHMSQDIATKVLRFDCNSSYPVEWIYSGPGVPFDVISKSFRHVSNFSESASYTFSTFLDLTRSDERNTGRYTCREIASDINNSSKIGMFFQVFVPGDKLFLPTKSKTIAFPKNATEFIVPCTISNPTLSSYIKLYKDEGAGTKSSRILQKTKYDAEIGFTVQLDPSVPFTSYKGRYFCKEPVSRKSSGKYAVQPPKEGFIQVSPNTNFVKIISGTKQIFICAAKENVTLTFAGDRQPRNIDFEMNPTSEFPYVAMFEINPMNITSEHTIINCVTIMNEVLHSWEYTTYGEVSIPKFYFDAQKRFQDARYVCCSNSYYKPKLEYTFCKTETECSMKRIVFGLDEETKDELIGEYRNRIIPLNDSCVMFHPYLKFTLPSGVLKCSVKGVSSEAHKEFMYYFNPYRIYQAYTDDKFDTSKVSLSESIMKLTKTPSKNTIVGEKLRFLCYFSELFLSNGVLWNVEFKNGSSYFIDGSFNNMNANTSFSQLELKFNDTNIRAVHCYAPIKDSPTAWRNVTGFVFVKESPLISATIQTTSGKILRELNVDPKTGVILDAATLEVLNKSGENFDGVHFVLECNAEFPVDFTYFGEGAPQLDYIPNRSVNGSLLDANSYRFSSKLRFLKVSQQIIGKYSCVSSTREFGHRNQEENLNSSIKVFVPGENLFISSENQTFRSWEYRDAVLIPCPISDPNANVTLLKFNESSKIFEPLHTLFRIAFDPLYGFSLSKNHTKSLFGLYKCVGDRNQTSGIIQIFLSIDSVKVYPYMKEVKISQNDTQTFKCESKENVTITFSDDLLGKKERAISQDFSPSAHYPYVVTYTTDIGEFTNLTWINCTTTRETRNLHTWELYPGDGAFIEQFTPENGTTEIKCCTPSFRTPVIEWINCSSVTECTIKQASCLTQNKCQRPDFTVSKELDASNMKNGCLTFDYRERGAGLLKCVVKGVHKIVAQAMVYYTNVETNYQVHDGYFLGTKMFDKFDIPTSQILRISSDLKDNVIQTKENVGFDCTGSKFFLSSNIKWAIEADNGTLYYMDGKDLSNYNQVHSRLDFVFETTSWKKVYCIAPIWKEYYGWRNVSFELQY